MTQYSDRDGPLTEPTPRPSVPIPLNKPIFTYVLLVAIALVWILTELAGGSTNSEVLIRFGANVGPLILDGQTWRLFTSMFLHVGFAHLAFNAYALLIFGFEMERIYGPDRYIVIYILAGLFGSLASFAWRGPTVFSAGASGAIFGIIGMNLAFFLLHRQTFGDFGRSRVTSTLIIIGINIVFGLTVPRIDNMAHFGGLVAGFALGYALAPRYELVDQYTLTPRVEDRVSWGNRWWVPVLAILILAGGLNLAILAWS